MRHVVDQHSEPLTEAVYLILLSLAPEPKHGYAIMKDVEEISSGRVKLSTGTLYGALRRLLESKWIVRFAEKEASRDRQAYRLTANGQAAMTAETTRMKSLTRVAANRMVERQA